MVPSLEGAPMAPPAKLFLKFPPALEPMEFLFILGSIFVLNIKTQIKLYLNISFTLF